MTLCCKTCNHKFVESGVEGCKVSSTKIPLPAKALIEYVGCASHSDTVSEREKVLNNLRNALTHKRVYHVCDDDLRGLTFYVKLSDIYTEIDRSLRKQGEQG
jgi:hypothetical protein